jgi:site-specific recombinase XerD
MEPDAAAYQGGRNEAPETAITACVPNEVVPLTEAAARQVLAVADSHRLAAMFRVALMMGLREGEVLGLRWSDVDLDARTLRVAQALQRVDGRLIFKEPKTAKSRRTLRIPQSVLEALRVHCDQQNFERAAAGDRWTDSGLVFVSSVGTPLDPRNVLRIWHCLLDKAGLEQRAFHVSRHTAVSLLSAEGVPLKVIKEVVGLSLLARLPTSTVTSSPRPSRKPRTLWIVPLGRSTKPFDKDFGPVSKPALEPNGRLDLFKCEASSLRQRDPGPGIVWFCVGLPHE